MLADLFEVHPPGLKAMFVQRTAMGVQARPNGSAFGVAEFDDVLTSPTLSLNAGLHGRQVCYLVLSSQTSPDL